MNNFITIISLPDAAHPIVYPETIPAYMLPISPLINQLQYICGMTVQLKTQEIWIIANPSLIPILKENIGEVYKYVYKKEKSYSKYLVTYVPIFYIEPLKEDLALKRTEPLWLQIRAATTIKNLYKKISLSLSFNKFLFWNAEYFTDFNCIKQLSLKKKKNCLFKFETDKGSLDFYTKNIFCLLDFEQINTMKMFYKQNKATNTSSRLNHKKLMSSVSNNSFSKIENIKIGKKLFRFKTIHGYFSYMKYIYENKINCSYRFEEKLWVFQNKNLKILYDIFIRNKSIRYSRLRNKKITKQDPINSNNLK